MLILGGKAVLCYYAGIYTGRALRTAHSQQSMFPFHFPSLWLVAEFDSLYIEENGLLMDYWLHIILKCYLWLRVVVSLISVATVKGMISS